MKTRHIVIILVTGAVTAIGVYAFLPHLQSPFPMSYANLELVGINETYNTNQVIKFQFKATGYGIPCDMPTITIYKSDQPSVIVFEKKSPPLMCPIESPTFFNVVYPSKNDTYSLTIKDGSKYTIHVSFLNKELDKEFEITKSPSTYLSQTVDEWKNKTSEPRCAEGRLANGTCAGPTGINLRTHDADESAQACDVSFSQPLPQAMTLPNGTVHTINKIPVFLMKPNSTGKICIENWSYDKRFNYSGKTSAGIGKNDSTVSDVTITAFPNYIIVDDTSNKTIVYTITTSNNAHGFYIVSPMFFSCGSLPLAVGFDSSHLFDNDFPWLWYTYPCPFGGITAHVTGVSGIDIAYITKIY